MIISDNRLGVLIREQVYIHQIDRLYLDTSSFLSSSIKHHYFIKT
jgi:hypothetical protein